MLIFLLMVCCLPRFREWEFQSTERIISDTSADHIQEIITLLLHQMEESVATTAIALGQVKEGQQAVHDAIGAFQEIISSVQNFADHTREISSTTGTQNQAADTITGKLRRRQV